MKVVLTSLIISIFSSTLAVLIYHQLSSKKIGYVKVGTLLEKYDAMLQANKTFESEYSVAKGNLDTLQKRYEVLKAQENNISNKDKAAWGYNVGMAQRDLAQYNQTYQEQLQRRQKELYSTVVNEVNKYIEIYGESHGYKLILGTTDDGSILYGDHGDDLTEAITLALNQQFAGKKGK